MKSWKDILVKPDQDFESLIQILHDGGMQFAVVIDEDRKLLGTVTDGDIRRALLKKFSMDISAKFIMNNNPCTASLKESESTLIKIMKKRNLFHLPLIDDKKRLVGIKLLHDLIRNEKYDNPVFIMAGGFGKRMLPITKQLPKPMLRINDTPILESILLRFKENGFSNFFISIFYKGDIIKKYFGDGSKWNININYVTEEEPLGTAGSLSLLKENKFTKPVIVMNGDIISKINFKELIQFHINKGNSATVCIKEHSLEVPFGVVKIEDECVKKIDEKPSKIFHVNAGIYVINPEIIQSLGRPSYMDMTDLISNLNKSGVTINSFPVYETWNDVGTKIEFDTVKKLNRQIK